METEFETESELITQLPFGSLTEAELQDPE